MHTHHLLLMFLLLVLVYPVGLTAQTPTPDKADIVDEEPLAEEGNPMSDGPTPADAGTISAVCGTASGTRFNLEPGTTQAQHTQSVDLLRRNRVARGGRSRRGRFYGYAAGGYSGRRQSDGVLRESGCGLWPGIRRTPAGYRGYARRGEARRGRRSGPSGRLHGRSPLR